MAQQTYGRDTTTDEILDGLDFTGRRIVITGAAGGLGVKRMVVGHTVRKQGINAACDGAVWRIDVGLAKLYDGPIEVLELADGAAPKFLKGTRQN